MTEGQPNVKAADAAPAAHRLDVNAGWRVLDVRPGRSVLAAMKSQGIFIPSACGGRGLCGTCRLRIAGGGPLTPAETAHLTPDELASGLRLACQVKVQGDLGVDVPPELLAVRSFRGRVEHIRDLTWDIKELRIALIDPPAIDFAAGQYIQLEVPAHGGSPHPVYRAYSVSSPPEQQDRIELIVRLVPGGIGTTWVFTMLKAGDVVRFNGPYGSFRLRPGAGPMVWIAGGSGMAPFWSMVRHMKLAGLARPCTFFFGAVDRRDLFLLDEIRLLERELAWFRFIPALSAPDGADAWDGETGLITEVVARNLSGGADLEAYLCGSPGMIDAGVEVLTARGVPAERIFFDKFG